MKEYKRLTDSETAVMLKNTEGSSWYSEEMEAQRYIRLAELEDKIEQGLLVPRYSILKDWQYGWWCVCEVEEQSRIIAQCKTEEEAEKKLKELNNENTRKQ